MNKQDIIVAEALTWLDTPYHHLGDVKGFGVDCAMLLVRVFCDTGLVPPFDPRPYAPDWHLHRSEQKFLGYMEQYGHRVEGDPQPGDVPLFQYGRCVSHGGIVISVEQDVLMVHADLIAEKVEIAEVRRWADRHVGYWRVNV